LQRLAVAFVAKQATIFGGMILWQRCLLALVMTGEAGELGFFFTFYGKETVVIIIVGKERGRFFRGFDKKNENSGTYNCECRIYQQQLFFSFFLHRKSELMPFTKESASHLNVTEI
jgi:hypothetical protein